MLMAQIMATVIFVVMFVLIVMDKIERQYVTLGCGFLTLAVVFGLIMRDTNAIITALNVKSIFTPGFWYAKGAAEEASAGINWATIIFIAGMMVMVEGMAHVGFFRWLCLKLASLVNYKPTALFLSFMVMSGVLAMFIDSITVILFLAAVTVELGRLLKFNPVPMILSEIFAANLGGSATMCGDPPNIIVGTSLGYSFGDFISNTGLMAGTAFLFVILYYYLVFRKELNSISITQADIDAMPDPKDAIKDKKGFIYSSIIFAITVCMLVTHAQTGLTVAFIGVASSLMTFIAAGKTSKELLKKVDYKTLLFFIGLFLAVSGLEQTGMLELLAELIGDVSGGSAILMIVIIIWLSAIASALVDNIPFAATMIPVIKALSAAQGVDLSTLAWALSMGTDVGGSATPIGASANVVGISVAQKNGYVIGWGKYCKTAIPATIIVLAISMIMIIFRYC